MKQWLYRHFPQAEQLGKSVWFLVIYTVAQAMSLLWQSVLHGLSGWYITAVLKMVLAVYAAWAVVNVLRYRIEGLMQFILVYGVGLFTGASTSGWMFDFTGFFAIHWVMVEPQYQYGATEAVGYSFFSVNLWALAFLVLIARNIMKLKSEIMKNQSDDSEN